MRQGLAQHSNQHDWLLQGSPEVAAPRVRCHGGVVAACEVQSCLQTQSASSSAAEPGPEGITGAAGF